MKDFTPYIALALGLMLMAACSSSTPEGGTSITEAATTTPAALTAKFLPADNQLLFITGQDLDSVRGYVNSGLFPEAGGVTTYMNIYDLRDEAKLYAGLGIDNDLNPVDGEADWWGGGPYNAWKSLVENPNSILSIGLDINENYGENGLARIANGEFDKHIDKLAGFAKKAERPIFLRIGYEFDGTWNRGYENGEAYKAAWRHIVDRMRTHKLNNVAYVWQSSTSPADDAIEGVFEEDLGRWYPGDDYVDWIGYSWFLLIDEAGTNAGAPSTQRQLTDQLLAFARKHQKPVLCAEAAPQGYFIEQKINANIGPVIDGPSGENRVPKTSVEIWQEWYEPFLGYIHENADIIRGLAYINCYWDVQPMWAKPYNSGLWGDSRIQTDPLLTENWLKELAKPIWLHGGPDTFEKLK